MTAGWEKDGGGSPRGGLSPACFPRFFRNPVNPPLESPFAAVSIRSPDAAKRGVGAERSRVGTNRQ